MGYIVLFSPEKRDIGSSFLAELIPSTIFHDTPAFCSQAQECLHVLYKRPATNGDTARPFISTDFSATSQIFLDLSYSR